jgi:hypothetical protein
MPSVDAKPNCLSPRSRQRPLGIIGQQPLCLLSGDLGQVSQLAGDPVDHLLGPHPGPRQYATWNFAAIACARLPAQRERSRIRVPIALPAAWIRVCDTDMVANKSLTERREPLILLGKF